MVVFLRGNTLSLNLLTAFYSFNNSSACCLTSYINVLEPSFIFNLIFTNMVSLYSFFFFNMNNLLTLSRMGAGQKGPLTVFLQ